ncbi:DNA modification methylase [Pseudacidovorax sp. 1753]|uniref:DNA methyltransferase n=1 Tax=Pseudacidovorax sp. 1753 TaxID=3156419 RepID=UPI0033910BE8
MNYDDFLRAKVTIAQPKGFNVDPAEIHPLLKPHQVAAVIWAIRLGCAALFMAFGLGKTFVQLEIVRLVRQRVGGMALIVIPLGVRQEFMRDAARLGIAVKFIRRIEEADDPEGIYLTNYETVRDRKLDPLLFGVASLDEAACLRGFGGSKTFREFMAMFAGDDRRDMGNRIKGAGVAYRFVATATPSPNEFVELLAYSAFWGVMDVGQAKTRFFKRNSEKADHLTLSPAREQDFWMWVASWALFVQKPSDLGYSDEGYELPPLDIRWHEIPADHAAAGADLNGQGQMFARQAIGVVDAAREKRESLDARVAKMLELRAEDPGAHRVIWHDLEDERRAIERAIPGVASVYGTQDPETAREPLVVAFSDGQLQELSSKPVLLGSGCNLQRHCAWAIYLGIGFKFADFIQSIHRLQRFLQTRQVRVDLIYTEAEREVRRTLERKWAQHKEQVQRMTEIIKEFGLSHAAMIKTLSRAMGVERVEVRAKGGEYTLVHNDCVKETRSMPSDSVGLVLTSIPFSTQYEYSPNFADFGHTDGNEHFFEQMDFLVPELLRVLKPGRVAAIHVKNRIVPSGMVEGVGFQTEYPFDVDTIACFRRHGFHFVGRKTIVTDVVRENNQTYRLGYSEQCKDGSRMGFGLCEYLLIFRKAPTDASRGYADVPVVKDKAKYSRPRWQFDAHGFARSSGNRFLTPEELEGLTHADVFKLFRQHSLEQVYDWEHDVRIGEGLAGRGMLPTTFMLLQPQSWHPDVWTDITRMRTLNGAQSAAGREQHLCPMQFDIAERAITQYSMEDEEVYDPFGGLMTVPYIAVKLGRRGRGCELSPGYFADGVSYCEAAVRERSTPSLFDLEREAA